MFAKFMTQLCVYICILFVNVRIYMHINNSFIIFMNHYIGKIIKTQATYIYIYQNFIYIYTYIKYNF